jgi:Family of unknown function (DUF6328)
VSIVSPVRDTRGAVPAVEGRRTTGGPQAERDETPTERLDRNLGEMMGELRVVVTGVQALFAFLLVVPFDSRFASVGRAGKVAYAVALGCAALSALCMIAPTAQHRILFRDHDKRHVVVSANRWVISGLVALALSMAASLLLVCDVLFGLAAGLAAGAVALALFAGAWFLLPLRRLHRHGPRNRPV